MAAVSDRDRRALTLLGGAAVLFLLLQMDFTRPAVDGAAAASDRIAALEQRLRLAEARAGRKPILEAELAAERLALEARERGLLTAESASLAQAEMRSLAGALLEAEGIPLASSRFERVEAEQEAYARVPIYLSFTCAIEQLVNLLAAVDAAPKLLAPIRLTVAPGNAEVKSVRVELTLAGYLPLDRTPELIKQTAGGAAGGAR